MRLTFISGIERLIFKMELDDETNYIKSVKGFLFICVFLLISYKYKLLS